MSYKEDLIIDPDMLDVEWATQAEKFMKYSEQLAEARKETDTVKRTRDIVRAEVGQRIRKNIPAGKKMTVGEVADAMTLDKEVQGIEKAFVDAIYTQEILQAAVRSLDQRKSALENLVRLAGQGYFATPTGGDRNLGEMVAERRVKTHSDVGSTLKARRKTGRKVRRAV